MQGRLGHWEVWACYPKEELWAEKALDLTQGLTVAPWWLFWGGQTGR